MTYQNATIAKYHRSLFPLAAVSLAQKLGVGDVDPSSLLLSSLTGPGKSL